MQFRASDLAKEAIKVHSCCVVDIFGDCGEYIHIIRHVYVYKYANISLLLGELAQVVTLWNLECMILQPSCKQIVAV